MANVQNPQEDKFDKKRSPQQNDWNSTQKADRKSPDQREINTESPTPYKPEIPQRNLPDVQAED